jgi:hypothetical protein
MDSAVLFSNRRDTMEARKTIKRMTKEAARRAMAKHVEAMTAKGWKVTQEFEGEAGIMFECITYFAK